MPNGKTLGVIPARKGSKRLPGKNMLLLQGKPMIQWTIEAALDSGSIDDVVVTSDDQSVLDLARSIGNVYVIERPADLASDAAKTSDVIVHTIRTLEQMGMMYETVCLLQATSPLRACYHIDEAFSTYGSSNRCSVISVCEVDHPLAWSNELDDCGAMSRFFENIESRNMRQDCKREYRINGAIYISSLPEFIQSESFLHADTRPYVMSRDRSVDIDDVNDFLMAEILMSKN